MLSRRHIEPLRVRYIGKESNRLEEREARLIGADDAINEYIDSTHDPFAQLIAPALRNVASERKLTVGEVAEGAGVSKRTVQRARGGQHIGKTAKAKLTAYAITHARAQLRATGTRPPTDHEALLATYLERQTAPDPEPRLCACGCRRPVEGRKRYLDPAHKQAAYRQRKAA